MQNNPMHYYSRQVLTPGEAASLVAGGCGCEDEARPRESSFQIAEPKAPVTKAQWFGVIGTEGEATGDGRYITPNAIKWDEAELPIPIRSAPVDNGGHDGAMVSGRILTIERLANGDLFATGDFDVNSEIGREAFRGVVEELSQGVSMDLDNVSFEVRRRETMASTDTLAVDEDGRSILDKFSPDDELMVTTDARIRAATIVAIPAFSRAKLYAVEEFNWVEKAGGLPQYIKRIAKHLQKQGKDEGHAIAIAVNAVKKMCATGDLNYPGKQNVNPGSKAEACAAVAEWEEKKARHSAQTLVASTWDEAKHWRRPKGSGRGSGEFIEMPDDILDTLNGFLGGLPAGDDRVNAISQADSRIMEAKGYKDPSSPEALQEIERAIESIDSVIQHDGSEIDDAFIQASSDLKDFRTVAAQRPEGDGDDSFQGEVLPEGWGFAPDPEMPGENIAFNEAGDGNGWIVLAQNEDGGVDVLRTDIDPADAPGEGESLGQFDNLDDALDFANPLLEIDDSDEDAQDPKSGGEDAVTVEATDADGNKVSLKVGDEIDIDAGNGGTVRGRIVEDPQSDVGLGISVDDPAAAGNFGGPVNREELNGGFDFKKAVSDPDQGSVDPITPDLQQIIDLLPIRKGEELENVVSLGPEAVQKWLSDRYNTKGIPQDLLDRVIDDLGGGPGNGLTAGGGPVEPPGAWFKNPALPGPTPLTVDKDGRVYGHLAIWGTCHTAYSGQCVEPPRSASNYAYFRTGSIITREGGEVAVGRITLDTLHAGRTLNATDTLAHYEHTGKAVADVVAGEDEFGIWIAGASRSNLSDSKMRSFRASPLSGDWRRIGGNLELVAALAVNSPGFPVTRPLGLVASGVMQSLVASGVVERPKKAKTKAVVEPLEMSADAIAERVAIQMEQRQKRRDEATKLARRLAKQRAAALASRVR